MATRSVSPTRRVLVAVALAAGTGLALSSCAQGTPSAAPSASDTPTASSSPSASQQPSPEASSSPEPSANAVVESAKINLDCSQLISNQEMYDYNPNISLLDNVSLSGTSNVSTVNEIGGLTCQWVNASSEETIDVGVAKLTDAEIENLKNLAIERSSSVPTYREGGAEEGYFSTAGKEAQAFVGDYWITMHSEMFLEPGDPQPLVADAIASLQG